MVLLILANNAWSGDEGTGIPRLEEKPTTTPMPEQAKPGGNLQARQTRNTGGVFDTRNRFLEDGWPDADLQPSVTLITSFESAEDMGEDWKTSKLVEYALSEEHATDGKHSLKVVFRDVSSYLSYYPKTIGKGWGGEDNDVYHQLELANRLRINYNDSISLDVFNPGAPVDFVVSVPHPNEYMDSGAGVTLNFSLHTGSNTLNIPCEDIRKNLFRTVTRESAQYRFSVSQPCTLYLDNMRWIGPGIGKNLLKYGKCFRFGKTGFNRPYFLPVDATTGYTKERGYGWEKPGDPKHYGYGMDQCDLSGRLPDDELTRGSTKGMNSPFLVDLPAGKYRLQVVKGAMMLNLSPWVFASDFSVRINDGAPQLLRRAANDYHEYLRWFFARDQVDYEPGEDLWRKMRAHLITPLECDFEVTNGQASFRFCNGAEDKGGNASVSFCLIYPVEKADIVEPDVAALWRDIRYRFFPGGGYRQASRAIAELMHLPGLHPEYQNPAVSRSIIEALRVTTEERGAGALVFNRPSVEEVYPDTAPSRAECASECAAFGPPGEIETFAPAIYALADLKDVRLDVGEFKSDSGRIIPPERVDARVVNCMRRTVGLQCHSDWSHMVMPLFLVKRDSLDIAVGTSRRYWINVDIPGDTPPGMYTAKASVRSKGMTPREIPLRLEVLPFKLDALPEGVEYRTIFSLGGHYYPPESYLSASKFKNDLKEAYLTRAAAYFKTMRRCGFTHVVVTVGDWGPSFDFAKTSMPGEMTQGLSISYGRYFGQKATDVDEAKEFNKTHKTLRLVEEMNEDGVSKLKQQGIKPIIGGYGPSAVFGMMQAEGGLYRFQGGFLMWRLGASGACFPHFNTGNGDPYSIFDGDLNEWGTLLAPASSGWSDVNPTQVLEGAREGIKDYRYLATLERLIREKHDTPAAKDAEAYLKQLREKIIPAGDAYFQRVGHQYNGWDTKGTILSQKETAWKGSDYSSERRRIAELIARLTGGQIR